MALICRFFSTQTDNQKMHTNWIEEIQNRAKNYVHVLFQKFSLFSSWEKEISRGGVKKIFETTHNFKLPRGPKNSHFAKKKPKFICKPSRTNQQYLTRFKNCIFYCHHVIQIPVKTTSTTTQCFVYRLDKNYEFDDVCLCTQNSRYVHI